MPKDTYLNNRFDVIEICISSLNILFKKKDICSFCKRSKKEIIDNSLSMRF